MRPPLIAALLLAATPLLSQGAAAQTAVERAQRQLDQQIQGDRLRDAARDARGDVRDGAAARVDALEADRAPLLTNRSPTQDSLTSGGTHLETAPVELPGSTPLRDRAPTVERR
ncbi:hypothetical protein [Roseomonas sp. BN140053]|uniref:hypothetical protein n=1 Tax=Roseomonas sp. BN140053 TaxID=3391898 RepID=UPI0039ED9711